MHKERRNRQLENDASAAFSSYSLAKIPKGQSFNSSSWASEYPFFSETRRIFPSGRTPEVITMEDFDVGRGEDIIHFRYQVLFPRIWGKWVSAQLELIKFETVDLPIFRI
jgi:hypothetical protein